MKAISSLTPGNEIFQATAWHFYSISKPVLSHVNVRRMGSQLLLGIRLKVFHLTFQQWKNTVQIKQASTWQVHTFATP